MSSYFYSLTSCVPLAFRDAPEGTVIFTSLQRSQALISYGGGDCWVGVWWWGEGLYCGEQETIISVVKPWVHACIFRQLVRNQDNLDNLE